MPSRPEASDWDTWGETWTDWRPLPGGRGARKGHICSFCLSQKKTIEEWKKKDRKNCALTSTSIFHCEFSLASCRCRSLTGWRRLEETHWCDMIGQAQAARTPTHTHAKRSVVGAEFGPKCSEGKHTLRVWWTRHPGRRRIICSFICFIPLDVCCSAVAAVRLAAEQCVDWAWPQVALGSSSSYLHLQTTGQTTYITLSASHTGGVAHCKHTPLWWPDRHLVFEASLSGTQGSDSPRETSGSTASGSYPTFEPLQYRVHDYRFHHNWFHIDWFQNNCFYTTASTITGSTLMVPH